MPATLPDDVSAALAAGGPAPADLSGPDERRAWDQLDTFWKHGLGYAQEMAGRPQTLYALADSPIGLAAWMLDHDEKSYELIARVFVNPKTRPHRSGDIRRQHHPRPADQYRGPSARLYWGERLPFFAPKGVKLPCFVTARRDLRSRDWTEKAIRPDLLA